MNLILGDCLEVLNSLAPQSIDLVLCDLPYGVTRNHWDSIIPLPALWKHYHRLIRPAGAIVLFCQPPFDKILGCSNLKDLRHEWIWEKTNASGHLNARRAPLKAHETILVFSSSAPRYFPQKTSGHPRKTSTAQHRRNSSASKNYGTVIPNTYDSTERFPRSVLKYAKDVQKSALHPTQKPVALCEYLIRTYTQEGENVLDNAMGSGTTGIACLNTHRHFIGVEKDPEMYSKAQYRIGNHII